MAYRTAVVASSSARFNGKYSDFKKRPGARTAAFDYRKSTLFKEPDTIGKEHLPGCFTIKTGKENRRILHERFTP